MGRHAVVAEWRLGGQEGVSPGPSALPLGKLKVVVASILSGKKEAYERFFWARKELINIVFSSSPVSVCMMLMPHDMFKKEKLTCSCLFVWQSTCLDNNHT